MYISAVRALLWNMYRIRVHSYLINAFDLIIALSYMAVIIQALFIDFNFTFDIINMRCCISCNNSQNSSHKAPDLEGNRSLLNHLTWWQSVSDLWDVRCHLFFLSLPARSTLETDQRWHLLHLPLESTSSSIYQHVFSPSAWQQPRPDQASGERAVMDRWHRWCH